MRYLPTIVLTMALTPVLPALAQDGSAILVFPGDGTGADRSHEFLLVPLGQQGRNDTTGRTQPNAAEIGRSRPSGVDETASSTEYERRGNAWSGYSGSLQNSYDQGYSDGRDDAHRAAANGRGDTPLGSANQTGQQQDVAQGGASSRQRIGVRDQSALQRAYSAMRSAQQTLDQGDLDRARMQIGQAMTALSRFQSSASYGSQDRFSAYDDSAKLVLRDSEGAHAHAATQQAPEIRPIYEALNRELSGVVQSYDANSGTLTLKGEPAFKLGNAVEQGALDLHPGDRVGVNYYYADGGQRIATRIIDIGASEDTGTAAIPGSDHGGANDQPRTTVASSAAH